MSIQSLLVTAWRQTGRDLKSGELSLLAVALLLAVTISTAIGLFGNRLEKGMGRQVAAVLGADLVVQGSQSPEPELKKKAEELGLDQSRTIEFPSVILAGDRLQMVSVKGVENGYPLRGAVRTADQPFAEDKLAKSVPQSGEVWLEPRLFPLLDIKVGDTITLGAKSLRVTQVITLESDRGKGFYSFSPRLMFNIADLGQTQLVQLGSRVVWRNLYAGPEQAVDQFRLWLKDNLTSQYQVLDLTDGNRGLSRSLTRVTGFLSLAAQLAILLSGIAIAMASRRFAQRHYDAVAILRCLGASRQETIVMVCLQLLFILPLIMPLALILGWLLSEGVVHLLADLLPVWLPAADSVPLVEGAVTGIIVLFGFALPPLLKLNGVTPVWVLKKEQALVTPVSAWLIYGLALVSLVCLSWFVTDNLSLTLSITLGAAVLLPFIGVAISAVLWFCTRLLSRQRVNVLWRTALSRLSRQRLLTLAQLLAFSLTLLVMAVALKVRTDLLDHWQEQLPDNIPNFFSLNIQSYDIGPLTEFMETRKISSSQMYPVLRGRLIAINEQPLDNVLNSDQLKDRAVNRELNLTWSNQLPEMNTLIKGRWWSTDEIPEVSVESGLAGRLGLDLGDTLTFNIAGQQLTATITSLRHVEWENFRPNFYMVMPEWALGGYPASWLNSFYLSAEQRFLLNEMIQRFPSLTLIDMDSVINQARQMIQQGVLALEAMLVVLFLAGLLVLWASIATSQDERIRESALLKALGASRSQLQWLQAGEFILLGGLAGLFAALGSELTTWLVFTRVLDLSWTLSPLMWFALPVLGALLVGGAGYLGTFKLIRRSPLQLLNDGG